LLGQLIAAQFSLEDAVAELERSGASAEAARSQLQALGDLQRQIAGAGPAALTSLRGEITNVVTASRQILQQGRAASNAESVEATLAAASARTRATVERIAGDLFERRIFDPYLHFASEEEERAYRAREAERRAYIDAQLARGTPEGNLNASAATVGQVLDAGANGADRSPEFERTKQDAFTAYRDQRTAMVAAGRSTTEADRQVAGEVRRVLQARGLSDTEIDARLAASADPLDALDTGSAAPQREASVVAPTGTAPKQASELDDVAAALRAAGVVPPPATTRPGHGLTANAQSETELGGRV
jgi:septum formation topological specificity factor MinE